MRDATKRAFSESKTPDELHWRFTREQIGHKLKSYYQATEELPPQLVALIKKLDQEVPAD